MSSDMAEVIGIAVGGMVAVMIIAASGLMLYLIIKALKGGTQKTARVDADETRMIQEVYHGLQRMEKRIESLETIIIDRDGTKESRFDRELRE